MPCPIVDVTEDVSKIRYLNKPKLWSYHFVSTYNNFLFVNILFAHCSATF